MALPNCWWLSAFQVSNKRGSVRTTALPFANGCSALFMLLQEAAGRGSSCQASPSPWLSGAGHKPLPHRPQFTTACWATYYPFYLQKLVDFPPQLDRLTVSETGSEFLVWTNQSTTKTTTKETVSEHYLQSHTVLNRKISNKKDTRCKTKTFLPQICAKPQNDGLLLIAYWHDLLWIRRVTFRLFVSLRRVAK